jgi:F-type H+-transporting ATPase subunit epsilon
VPLTVQVVTPERELTVSDDATLVIARSVSGDTGIMPGMAPYLAALGTAPLTIVHGDGRRELIAVDGGFIQVNRDQVIVLAEFAALPQEIDREDVARRLEDIRRRATAAPEDPAIKQELARAELLDRFGQM